MRTSAASVPTLPPADAIDHEDIADAVAAFTQARATMQQAQRDAVDEALCNSHHGRH